MGETKIPARHGKAAHMKAGQRLKLTNLSGDQVVDTWAFCDPDVSEFMSMEHTRNAILNIFVRKGETLVSNKFKPMLTLEDDTSDGGHDTLAAACSPEHYRFLGVDSPPHRACATNLIEGLSELGLGIPEQPSPWNLFQHSTVNPDGSLSHIPADNNQPGCDVTLKAECDLVIAFSCCPWEIEGMLVNGADGEIHDCVFEIT